MTSIPSTFASTVATPLPSFDALVAEIQNLLQQLGALQPPRRQAAESPDQLRRRMEQYQRAVATLYTQVRQAQARLQRAQLAARLRQNAAAAQQARQLQLQMQRALDQAERRLRQNAANLAPHANNSVFSPDPHDNDGRLDLAPWLRAQASGNPELYFEHPSAFQHLTHATPPAGSSWPAAQEPELTAPWHTASEPELAIGAGQLHHVFTAHADTYKLVGMLGTEHGLFATTSNVYRGAFKSRIYLDGACIYEGNQETIGQPFAAGGAVYFPVEHGSHALKYQDGAIVPAGPTAGAWSVAGMDYHGQPVVAYNNDFGPGGFGDKPVIVNADTGERLFTLDATGMPRKMVMYNGEMWATTNFGENVLVSESGKKIAVDTVHIEVFDGALYGGGGSSWGPSPTPENANGKIYRFDGTQMVELFDTGSCSIQYMGNHGGALWVVGTDPDQVYAFDGHAWQQVAALPGQTAADQARSFGGAVAYHDGQIYWGQSDQSAAHVHKVT